VEPLAPAERTVLKRFLEHQGSRLVEFERATTELDSGQVPRGAACAHLKRQALPASAQDARTLQQLTERVPELALRLALQQNMQAKMVILGGCQTAKVPDPVIATAKSTSALIRARFRQVGVG
jgi:hypothetical protein